LAGLVYLGVTGPILEKASVSRFFTPGFLEYGQSTSDTQILNRGDYHIVPRGLITLTNIFGTSVDRSFLKEENIFPDMRQKLPE